MFGCGQGCETCLNRLHHEYEGFNLVTLEGPDVGGIWPEDGRMPLPILLLF